MILQIIIKELRQSLLSLRFSISTVLVIVLFAGSAFLFRGRYAQQLEDYQSHRLSNLGALKAATDHLYDLVMLEQVEYKPPQALTFCVNGYEDTLPDQFCFDPFVLRLPQVKTRHNAFLPFFSDIDWIFILSTIVSLTALLLSYDAVCGEKQTGTLGLMLSGMIPRFTLLMGKYLGILLSLGISIFAGLLFHLLIVTLAPTIQLTTGQWCQIGMVVVLSLIYVSLFIWLGLLVSSRVHQENHSMIVLLLIWVGFVFLVPGFGRILSDVCCPAPTQSQRQRELAIALEDVVNESRAGTFGDNAGSWNSYNDNPPAGARYYQARVQATNHVHEKHFNQMVEQVSTGRRLTAFSPRILYQRAAEAIAGVGIYHVTTLYQQIKDYQAQWRDFITGCDASDADSLHLLFQFPDPWLAQNWKAISKQPVDYQDIPKFRERPPALVQSLESAVWDIGVLMLFNIAFSAAAFVSFLKYDVR